MFKNDCIGSRYIADPETVFNYFWFHNKSFLLSPSVCYSYLLICSVLVLKIVYILKSSQGIENVDTLLFLMIS